MTTFPAMATTTDYHGDDQPLRLGDAGEKILAGRLTAKALPRQADWDTFEHQLERGIKNADVERYLAAIKHAVVGDVDRVRLACEEDGYPVGCST